MIISARSKDLGEGFVVQRVLPVAGHRMVGPFIFFDHMGPVSMAAGKKMDVRPHPHINLATVSYLFEGKIEHRDSLGNDQMIEPGAINWMTAGRGIVHSERTPKELLNQERNLHGIQLWVALPESEEECPPAFSHHSKETLPEFSHDGVPLKLLLGSILGQESPVPVKSKMFYLEAKLKKDQKLSLPLETQEGGAYVVRGVIGTSQGETVPALNMLVHTGGVFEITALEDTHLMILGGAPVGPREIFWNFVSSSKVRLEEAKRLWLQGPSDENPRFQRIPGDDQEFIPLP